MAGLRCESYVFDPRPRYPLRIAAKRYWHPDHCPADADALTLVLTHGTGLHKELWEPTLEHLYARARRGDGPRIREAWALDAPNHGASAVLNEDALVWSYWPGFGWEEYSRSIHAFLLGLGTDIPSDVDFRTRKLVAIGHSMGATATLLADTFLPTLRFASIILVEPMLAPKPRAGEPDFNPWKSVAKRPDVWASREEAKAFFASKGAYKAWDARALDIYVAHGLRALPSAVYPDKTGGVTLACPRAQESASYLGSRQGIMRALEYLPHVAARVPVHFVYGAVNDYLPKAFQEHVMKIARRAGRSATYARVPGGGHLTPQQQPQALADALWAALQHDADQASRSLAGSTASVSLTGAMGEMSLMAAGDAGTRSRL